LEGHKLQAVDKVNNDIDCASYGSRQEQKADGQPEESTNTLELAGFGHRRILLRCIASAQIKVCQELQQVGQDMISRRGPTF
jgi:hypothetical protein